MFGRKKDSSGNSSFDQRMHDASEHVYSRIEAGQVTDVEAELMDAHHHASTGTERD